MKSWFEEMRTTFSPSCTRTENSRPSGTEHPDKNTLVLSLNGDGSLCLNADEIPETELLTTLKSTVAVRTDKTLFP